MDLSREPEIVDDDENEHGEGFSDYANYLHIPKDKVVALAEETYAFVEKRMRELDPDNADKPVCVACVGMNLHNTLVTALAHNAKTWDVEKAEWTMETMLARAEEVLETARSFSNPLAKLLRGLGGVRVMRL